MQVEIISGLRNLESLPGLVVVLDIFRASNTIIALLAHGAAEVVLISDLEEARRLRARRPGRLLLGERQGITPPDFDGGNSPVEAGAGAFAGRRVILTTSAGTQAVGRLRRAARVFFGSFANAAALCRALKTFGQEPVYLLPMGLEAREPALEDELAARYLAGLLQGRPLDFKEIRPQLLACDGADRLRSLNQHADLEFCTTLDSQQTVPVVDYDPLPHARPLA